MQYMVGNCNCMWYECKVCSCVFYSFIFVIFVDISVVGLFYFFFFWFFIFRFLQGYKIYLEVLVIVTQFICVSLFISRSVKEFSVNSRTFAMNLNPTTNSLCTQLSCTTEWSKNQPPMVFQKRHESSLKELHPTVIRFQSVLTHFSRCSWMLMHYTTSMALRRPLLDWMRKWLPSRTELNILPKTFPPISFKTTALGLNGIHASAPSENMGRMSNL